MSCKRHAGVTVFAATAEVWKSLNAINWSWFCFLFLFFLILFYTPLPYAEFSLVEIQFIACMRKGRASFLLISLRNALNCQLEDR